jgi:hypothetical protein
MKFWIGPEIKYPYLIAMDRTFFNNNFNDISDWANHSTPGWRLEGFLIVFNSPQDRLAFLLRWD